MKILIAYYSRTGGTEKLAEAIKKEFEVRGHSVDLEKVKPIKEHNFLGWWHIRMIKGECEIQPPKIRDVSKYDAVCVGSPNWSRLSLPMARYLREVEGLKYKKIGFFATTAAPPAFEWYILSAYLLDLTLFAPIDRKGGRIIDSILLSSIFKRWGVNSDYGGKKIKKFCDKIETPILSFKDYVLNQKEVESVRLSAVVFSAFLILSLILHSLLQALDKGFLDWGEYFYFFAIPLLTFILLTIIKEREVGISFGKYIGGVSAVLLWTLTMFYTDLGLGLGRVMIWGYILIFIIIGFFRDQKAVIFSGLMSFLGYGILFYIYPAKEVFKPSLDLVLIGIGCGVIALVTNSLQKYYYSLLEAQDEIETARTSLEIKVAARTRELKELAGSLDEQVKERTKELREKLEELEKFNRLAVGRELKMIELKEEIKKLKEELEKLKLSK